MKPILLAAALALCPLSPALAQSQPQAQPQPTRTLYVDLDQTARLSDHGLSAADQAANDLAVAAITALRADLNATQNTTEQMRDTASDQAMVDAAGRIDALQRSIRAAEISLSHDHQTRLNLSTHRFYAALDPALEAYITAHGNLIIQFQDASNTPSTIVLNQTYEISDSIAEMIKSGPGAEIPAAPTYAAIPRFIEFDRAFEQSAAAQDVQRFSDTKNAELLALTGDVTQLQQQMQDPTLDALSIAKLRAQHGTLMAQYEQQDRLFRTQTAEETARAKQAYKANLVDFIRAHPELAPGADIVHIYSAGAHGSGYVVSPNLDITATVAAAMQAAKVE